MKKYLSIIFALFVLSYAQSAHADKEFIQKAQNMAAKIQLKAKEVQEKIETEKAKLMAKVQAAQDMKSKAEEAAKQAKEGNLDGVKSLKEKAKATPGTEGKDVKNDKEAVGQAMEEKMVVKEDEGDSIKAQKEMDNFMQEVLRDSVSQLYAVAYSTRANFNKETTRDVDKEATDQIWMETTAKASKCVERISMIYLLKSMSQSFNYIEAMQTIRANNGQQEENKE